MTTPHPIRSHVKAVDMILTAAEAGGLPLPHHINVTPTSVRFMFDTLDQLTHWALYVDEPIADEAQELGRTAHTLNGVLFDEPISMVAFTTPKPPACGKCQCPKSEHIVFGAGCALCGCVRYRAPYAAAVPA